MNYNLMFVQGWDINFSELIVKVTDVAQGKFYKVSTWLGDSYLSIRQKLKSVYIS